MIHTLNTGARPRPPVPDDGNVPVVVYSRSGRLALALARNPADPDLAALRARLAVKGYTVLTRLPAGALAGWAATDTPARALARAGLLLQAMGGA